MNQWIAVCLGGAVGALLRYGVSVWVSSLARGAFPLATFVVNGTGAFALGIVATVATTRPSPAPPLWTTFLAVGLLGSFTTFSTFSWELLQLLRQGLTRVAVLYLLASLLVGMGGVLAGAWVASRGAWSPAPSAPSSSLSP